MATVVQPKAFSAVPYMAKRFSLDDTHLLLDSHQNHNQPVVTLNYDEFWNKVAFAQDRDVKILLFKNLIKSIVRNILKMEADERIDDQTEFLALGIDSLMIIELKSCLQNFLDSRMSLAVSMLKECENIEMLANQLVSFLEKMRRFRPSG